MKKTYDPAGFPVGIGKPSFTDKEIREAKSRTIIGLTIYELLEMKFGDGTGEDMQVQAATKDILGVIKSYYQRLIDEIEQEVIGEDENTIYPNTLTDAVEFERKTGANNLRAEQRKKLAEYKV